MKKLQESIGIIGLGKMGEALAYGLCHSKASPSNGHVEVQASCRSESSATIMSKKLGINVHTDSAKLVRDCNIILLCVKPFQAKDVLESLTPHLTKGKLLVSICAGLTLKKLKKYAGDQCMIIRSMPNTPALINQGMTVLAAGPGVSEKDLSRVTKIFENVGRVATVDEVLMDGVTGLSGCGPAYAFLMIEALSDAGVKVGIKRELSTLLAAQTLLGAAQLVLKQGIHPAALKDQVSTPAGCTIDGLMALEEGKLRVTLIKAVLAASKRSAELS